MKLILYSIGLIILPLILVGQQSTENWVETEGYHSRSPQ